MSEIVEAAIECEHCGEYTMFGVLVPDAQKLAAAIELAKAAAYEVENRITPPSGSWLAAALVSFRDTQKRQSAQEGK